MGKFNVYGAGNKRTIHVKNEKHKDDIFFLTLSLLGYLKTRICWGEGQLTPPPLNPMFDD